MASVTLDVSPAILIPFYDEDNNTVFLRWVDSRYLEVCRYVDIYGVDM